MSRPDLPLPGFDQLPLGDVRHRVRSLDQGELRTLIEHEHEHGNRAPVLALLEARLDELDRGAQPAPSDQQDVPAPPVASGDSAARPDTGAEPSTPLRHGVADQSPRRATR